MNSFLRDVDEIDNVLRQLHKMESKMRSGQWIDAWRDCGRIIAAFENKKRSFMQGQAKSLKGGDDES